MAAPILSVRNLTTKLLLGNHPYSVVDDLSFDLYRGKTLALVGESGCGKTMAALSIMGILPRPPALAPTGNIIYNGKDLLSLSEREMRKLRGAKLAMIFQDPATALNPVYTIGSQLCEAIALHLDLYGEEAEERALRALAEVAISDPGECLNTYPHQLSGGMKQRAMIAMALIAEPDLLIADEPTTALDVTIQAQVLELMRALQSKKGMAMLLITHDLGVVAAIADEALVMYAAQSVESAPVEQLFDAPAHPYTMGLFNSRVTTSRGDLPLQPIEGAVPAITHFPQGCRFHPRCPFVMEKCKQHQVENFTIRPTKNQKARCLLYDGTAESNAKRDDE